MKNIDWEVVGLYVMLTSLILAGFAAIFGAPIRWSVILLGLTGFGAVITLLAQMRRR